MRRGDGEAGGFASSDDRLVRDEGMWFYESREGRRGPFLSRHDAEVELACYVDTMSYLEEARVAIPSKFDTSNVTVIRLNKPEQ